MAARDNGGEIAATRLAQETLYRTEDRLRGILSAADTAIVSVDDEGLVLDWNPMAEAMFGWARREAVGRRLVEMISAGPAGANGRELDRLLGVTGADPVERRDELSLYDREGQPFPAEVSVSCLPAGSSHILHAFIRDLGPQRQAEEDRLRAEAQLNHRVTHDSLTGLPRRPLVIERLQRLLDAAQPGAPRVGVLVIDVDGLRVINDTLGHRAGDQLLIGIAARLREVVAGVNSTGDDEGALGRLGGDEYAMVFGGVAGMDDAVALAEAVAAGLSAPFRIAGERVFVTASTGVALGGLDQTPERLLSDADTAMHEAKERGRGRYQAFDAPMRFRMVERLRGESELRLALERDELRLHYQPIVALTDGGIVSGEALVRWQHPTRGLLLPAKFLPVAEQTGMIVPIDRWVLEAAFTQAAEWNRDSPLEDRVRISVNLSGHQLMDVDAVPLITDLLDRTGLAPSRLALEITETVLMTELDTPIESLRQLQALGVRIVLDDFGTGYSSLSYLRRLPLDAIKLDRSFVSRLEESSTDRQIVAAVVQLARALQMTVVAEGIETAGQLACLRDLGCHFAQGYFLARPMPPERFRASLADD